MPSPVGNLPPLGSGRYGTSPPQERRRTIVTIPLESVAFRTGAIPRKEMIVVLDESATKKNIKAATSTSGSAGLDLETVVSIQAWIRRLGEPQFSWVDLHVFDDCDQLVRSETLPLAFVGDAEDDGAVYGFEGSVYRGTGASPGSVWLAPDARKLQYRLYAEAGGTVYSDGLLRQHELLPDSQLTNAAEPPSRRKRAAAASKAKSG